MDSKNSAKFEEIGDVNCTKASPQDYAGKSIEEHVVFYLNKLDCNEPVRSAMKMTSCVIMSLFACCFYSILY